MQVAATDNEQITLNVGGSLFKTTATTLRDSPAPSLFAAMFSGRHALNFQKVDFCMAIAVSRIPALLPLGHLPD